MRRNPSYLIGMEAATSGNPIVRTKPERSIPVIPTGEHAIAVDVAIDCNALGRSHSDLGRQRSSQGEKQRLFLMTQVAGLRSRGWPRQQGL